MSQDMNINALRTNCFRQSKVKGEYMLQMRVPGGLIQAKYLSFVEHLAEAYGDGTFHFGSRQCFAIPGIKYENIDAVNKELKDYLEDVEIAMRCENGNRCRLSDHRCPQCHGLYRRYPLYQGEYQYTGYGKKDRTGGIPESLSYQGCGCRLSE